tara:strand:+ start:4548 stop:4832 length:285 start_codon:yes stop_codon:yes gene_type:complete
MKMNYYSIKKLIKGYRVNPNLKSKTLIAIPQKKLYSHYGFIPIQVNFKDKKMSITRNTPLLHKEQFRDKFNRGTFYTLLYYEWNPSKVQLEINF